MASQRRGRIDPNPHQVEAVIFALSRIPEGGCILADEVGLGKTIEAGLIMAQLLAEGMERILVIVPKPLLGQWQEELYRLFGIQAREGAEGLDGPGVFLVGREFAGSERGAGTLASAAPFGLCVIDEAHEIFAGIYKRFDKHGDYKEDADGAVMAHRVRGHLGHTPVLLLTATPIQNSLTELWGLVQYVEPTGTLLGDIQTFREVFCDGDDRRLVPDQAFELRKRIATVCQRTLRRQAQDFLEKPFVNRQAQLFEYRMRPEEKSLYDDVTSYLLEPELCAFRGNQRRLLLIGFHRRMASSSRALAASLRRVEDRLKKMLEGRDDGNLEAELLRSFGDDLEAVFPTEETVEVTTAPEPGRVQTELERVHDLAERAETLPHDSKAEALLEALNMIRQRHREGIGSGKAVLFTESVTTQEYLQSLLLEKGDYQPGDITLFRGGNRGPRAQEALEHWMQDVGSHLPVGRRPSGDTAVRLALVHEFAHHSKVFIATEAGAKGLNLQFCDVVVNYDLPWNPQRIEQRIGRCHRYGQTRGVKVINFLAQDNEAQRLTFEILSQKLDLFGTLLDASDTVLYEPSTDAPEPFASVLGADFEAALNKIYQRARTVEEIEAELRQLRDTVAERRRAFEETLERTAGLIDTWLDDSVRRVFRRIQEELPPSLQQLDRDLESLLVAYLERIGVPFGRSLTAQRVIFEISPSPALPEAFRHGAVVAVGPAPELDEAEPLHLGHPLVLAAVETVRKATVSPRAVTVTVDQDSGLVAYAGLRGKLLLTRVGFNGFEGADTLLLTSFLEGHEVTPFEPDENLALLQSRMADRPPLDPPLSLDDQAVKDGLEEAVFLAQLEAGRAEQERFDQTTQQVERFVEDRILVLNRQRRTLVERLSRHQRERDASLSSEKRSKAEGRITQVERRLEELEQDLQRLQTRQDEDYQKWRSRAYDKRFRPPDIETLMEVEFVLA